MKAIRNRSTAHIHCTIWVENAEKMQHMPLYIQGIKIKVKFHLSFITDHKVVN